MRKFVGAGLALSVGLSAAACELPSKEDTVDMSIMPAELPPGVGKMVANVVDFHDMSHGKKYEDSAYGSGVLINDKYVLSAGHVALFGKTQKQLGSVKGCERLFIDTQLSSSINVAAFNDTAYYVKLENVIGSAVRGVASFDAVRDSVADASVMEITYAGTRPLKTAKLKMGQEPSDGEPLFFINFEPDEEGNDRTPNADWLTDEQIQAGYAEPAIYGGIMIADENNRYVVATDVKNYGEVEDYESRGGASGGAVFNADGGLVGLVVRTSVETMTVQETGGLYDKKIVNSPKEISTEIVQPIRRGLIKRMLAAVKRAEPCA